MNDLKTLVTFEDTDIEIIDQNGERWVTVRDLGKALGYTDTIDLRKIIDRHPEEFKGKTGVVKLSTIKGLRDHRVINYHGVIRAAMLARTPRAIKFRDWAEEVLFKVMTTGFYSVHTPPPPLTVDQRAANIVESAIRVARLCRAPEHIGIMEGVKRAELLTGFSFEEIALQAPAVQKVLEGEIRLEPTELGKRFRIPGGGAQVNQILKDAGLQVKQDGEWTPTEKGAELAVRGMWKKGAKTGYNLRWSPTDVGKFLKPHSEPEQPELHLIQSETEGDAR